MGYIILAETCHSTGLHQGHCKKWSQELSLYLLLKDIMKDDVSYKYTDDENRRKDVSVPGTAPILLNCSLTTEGRL